MRKIPALAITLLLTLSCTIPPPTEKEIQAYKAEQAANSINFDENAEIDNIRRRLQLTSDPGLAGYILLLNDAGQPIMYTTVKGKITSSGKRLTSAYGCDNFKIPGTGTTTLQCDGDVEPSDEGTYGHSDPYIYFWTVGGQYYQWNGSYLYSDKPFRTNVAPLVIDVEPPATPAPGK